MPMTGEVQPQDEDSGLVERSWVPTHRKGGTLTERTLEGGQVEATFLKTGRTRWKDNCFACPLPWLSSIRDGAQSVPVNGVTRVRNGVAGQDRGRR